MATVHGTGGGAYDPLLSRRTYSQPKVDHTAEYVQMGTMLTNMLGSIFIANAQASAQARGAGGAAYPQAHAMQQTDATLDAYRTADEAYDNAKEKMADALTELSDLKAEYKTLTDDTAKGGLNDINNDLAALDDKAGLSDDNSKAEAQAKIDLWNKDSANYEKDFAEYNKFLDFDNKVNNFDTSGLKINGKSASPDTSETTKVSTSKQQELTLKADGNALATVTSQPNLFEIEVVNGNDKTTQIDTETLNNAKNTARELDNTFKANQRKAAQYNDLVAQRDACKVQQAPEKPDPNDDKYKINDSMTAEDYSKQKKDLDTKKTSLIEKRNDPKAKERLEAKIESKKNAIRGELTTNLNNAKKAFNIAQGKVEALRAKATSLQNSEKRVANAKIAANSKTSKQNRTGGFLGLFKHKSVQDKNYKAAKTDFKQQNQNFTAANGYNYSDMLSQISAAQSDVDAKNIDLDESYKSI